jgi:predicted DNA-binding protein
MNQLLPKHVTEGLRAKRAIRRRRQEILVSMRISRLLYKKIQLLAKKIDRTQSWVMREAVESWVTWKTAEKKVENADSAVHHDD